MNGVAKDLEPRFTPDEWEDLTSTRLDLTGTYARKNGDTAMLPMRYHARWADKGLTLVALDGPAALHALHTLPASLTTEGIRQRQASTSKSRKETGA